MVTLGAINSLTVLRSSPGMTYLDGEQLGEIELSGVVAGDYPVASVVQVFVYLDSDDVPVATTAKPYAMVNEFAWLKVVSVEQVGAFLDWGLPKDLLLPFAEQKYQVAAGDHVLVRVYLDNSRRLAASTRLDRYLDDSAEVHLKPGQQVQLLVADRTDLGFKTIVNNLHWGMLYGSDLAPDTRRALRKGQRHSAYVVRIRTDRKIDVTLVKPVTEQVDELIVMIIQMLKDNDGYMLVSDKSSPETIFSIFKVSKKVFKKALGALYKQRLIVIEKQGIRLLNRGTNND